VFAALEEIVETESLSTELGSERPNLKAYKKLGKLLKPARTESSSGFG